MNREALEQAFHERALRVYEDAKNQIGYRATRYLLKVRRDGGVAAAKAWLVSRSKTTPGFQRLLEHDRLDLSVEAVVLEPQWAPLFTEAELKTAHARLEAYGYFVERPDPPEPVTQLWGDEVPAEDGIPEGAWKAVLVNAYERDPRARADCIARYKAVCSACEFDFAEVYGEELGAGFIHVHHLNPLSMRVENRITRPLEDLRPVCPNCHAMLHRRNPPIPVPELRELVAKRRVDREKPARGRVSR